MTRPKYQHLTFYKKFFQKRQIFPSAVAYVMRDSRFLAFRRGYAWQEAIYCSHQLFD